MGKTALHCFCLAVRQMPLANASLLRLSPTIMLGYTFHVRPSLLPIVVVAIQAFGIATYPLDPSVKFHKISTVASGGDFLAQPTNTAKITTTTSAIRSRQISFLCFILTLLLCTRARAFIIIPSIVAQYIIPFLEAWALQ